MHLFPAIDLRGGKVVRLYQGDYNQQTTYGDDPVYQAKAFEDAGATWLHVVDLDGARTGTLGHREAIHAICQQTQLKVEVGGGVRSEATIDALLRLGVTRTILGTAALKNWAWFESLMGNPTYRGRLVLGLDARDGKLAVDGWEQTTDTTAVDVAARVSDWPLAAIVYTDIATDGTLEGPNIQQTKAVCEATHVPIVASGGVGTLQHLRDLRDLPLQGAIIGRSLYDNRLTIDGRTRGIRKTDVNHERTSPAKSALPRPRGNATGGDPATSEAASSSESTLQGYFDWQVNTLMLAYDLNDPLSSADPDAGERRRRSIEEEVPPPHPCPDPRHLPVRPHPRLAPVRHDVHHPRHPETCSRHRRTLIYCYSA